MFGMDVRPDVIYIYEAVIASFHGIILLFFCFIVCFLHLLFHDKIKIPLSKLHLLERNDRLLFAPDTGGQGG